MGGVDACCDKSATGRDVTMVVGNNLPARSLRWLRYHASFVVSPPPPLPPKNRRIVGPTLTRHTLAGRRPAAAAR
ncbi:hypothetical protein J6590_076160 [Homalodisca vitripennis]|nr:hypothetical protein J6590_076160 [Homalodisca vitripennis]